VARERETTSPVSTRITRSALSAVDALARELKLSRGSVLTLLISVALRNQDSLLGSFRELRGRTTHGGIR
jgi:hypothetical protein